MNINKSLLTLAILVAFCSVSLAETVHQTSSGDNLYTGDGGNAVEKGKMEAKKVDGCEAEKIARITGKMSQWGFVTSWFGLPTPAGKAIIRIRMYVDDQPVAKYGLYIANKSGQKHIGLLKIPADAKPNTFVSIDVPANATEEWSGLTIKKMDKSENPSPWLDTISVVLPD